MGKQLKQRLVLQLTYKNYIAFKKRQVVATDRQLVLNENELKPNFVAVCMDHSIPLILSSCLVF